jgi:hypothetical protein
MKADVFSEHRYWRAEVASRRENWSRIVTEYAGWVKACNKFISQKNYWLFCRWQFAHFQPIARFFLRRIVQSQTMEDRHPELAPGRLL